MSSGILPASTANLILGGGTWSGGSAVQCNLILAGNITISGTVFFGNSATPTLTYSSGTITTTGSTLSLQGSVNLNTNGVTWNILSISSGGTVILTLTSNLNAVTLTQTSGILTETGAFNLSLSSATFNGGTVTWAANQTISISNSLTMFNITFKSGTASSPLYVQYTGVKSSQNIFSMIFTDVQATGNKLYNYNGSTLTRTSNIVNVNASNINPKAIQYYNGAV